MSEFKKWYEENSWDIENHYDAEKAYEAGVQSKQVIIDELRKRIDEAIKALERSKPLMICYSDALLGLGILKGTTNEK